MKRVQLFEFEDFSWFPDWMRTALTNLLVVLIKMMGVQKVLAKKIAEILKENNLNQIVDLGSGAGGAMPLVLESLKMDGDLKNVTITLTDLYPSSESIETLNKIDGITFQKKPVDATDFSTAPTGLKTMINSFHHMRPEQARQILESAIENKQPFLIYELGDNKIPLLVWWLLLPISILIMIIMVWFMTPFVRPLTFKQLFFTYIIPVIPIFYAWDGQASLPRIYTLEDMKVLLEGLHSEDYSWALEDAINEKGKNTGIFVMGLPK